MELIIRCLIELLEFIKYPENLQNNIRIVPTIPTSFLWLKKRDNLRNCTTVRYLPS